MIAPHLPRPADCGRTRETDLRDVINAIFYIAQTGCQWRLLPQDLPPYTRRCSDISTRGATAVCGKSSIMCC